MTNRPATVVALLLCLFMAALEATVVSTAMPTIVGALGGVDRYAGVFTAYLLTSTVLVPVYGKAADLYGRKPLLLGGVVVFLVGSVLSGFAPTMNWLIAFRALQGLGAGALMPIAITIVGDLFSFEERARIQGLFGSVWGVAGLIGPLAGGLIVKHLSWPWVFFVNVPFGIIALIVLQRSLKENLQSRPRKLDVAGALIATLATVSLLAAAQGGRMMVPALAIAVISIAGLIRVELRAPEPILPPRLFARPVMSVSSIAGALIGSGMYGMTTFVPLFVQGVRHGSPTEAGVAIAPMIVGWPVASFFAGRLLPTLGFRALVRFGLALAALGVLGIAVFLQPNGSMIPTWVSGALFGCGLGFANTALIIAVQTSVSWEQRGVATASAMFVRSIGGALGIGFTGGILASALMSDPSVPRWAADRLLGPDHGKSLDPALVAKISGALEMGLHTVFWVLFAFAAAAFLLGLLFPRVEPIKDEPVPVAAPVEAH